MRGRCSNGSSRDRFRPGNRGLFSRGSGAAVQNSHSEFCLFGSGRILENFNLASRGDAAERRANRRQGRMFIGEFQTARPGASILLESCHAPVSSPWNLKSVIGIPANFGSSESISPFPRRSTPAPRAEPSFSQYPIQWYVPDSDSLFTMPPSSIRITWHSSRRGMLSDHLAPGESPFQADGRGLFMGNPPASFRGRFFRGL